MAQRGSDLELPDGPVYINHVVVVVVVVLFVVVVVVVGCCCCCCCFVINKGWFPKFTGGQL